MGDDTIKKHVILVGHINIAYDADCESSYRKLGRIFDGCIRHYLYYTLVHISERSVMTPTDKLLPCPFCGGRPVKRLSKVHHCQLHGEPSQDTIIECRKCQFEIVRVCDEYARDAWNQRHPATTPLPDAEALVEKLKPYSYVHGRITVVPYHTAVDVIRQHAAQPAHTEYSATLAKSFTGIAEAAKAKVTVADQVDKRTAFEVWAGGKGLRITKAGHGDYIYDNTKWAWLGYKASKQTPESNEAAMVGQDVVELIKRLDLDWVHCCDEPASIITRVNGKEQIWHGNKGEWWNEALLTIKALREALAAMGEGMPPKALKVSDAVRDFYAPLPTDEAALSDEAAGVDVDELIRKARVAITGVPFDRDEFAKLMVLELRPYLTSQPAQPVDIEVGARAIEDAIDWNSKDLYGDIAEACAKAWGLATSQPQKAGNDE